ncbi:DUF2625 family protein [Lentzea sp. BCCO 10_0061]|uniref:DUF2625 family protein n=1 Tax=Lentzea sokolovensis TaxID=3095429 RepID=A0ABU4URE9_9PSEU|nr:DUF2625 family protein [Lentzea sp. BCCO 10_0061]MDX8141376.1 DUF2625 family protein [Lentzea sp. BCCO 10_0061]
MRNVAELVEVPTPAWPWLVADLDRSFAQYTVLPPDPAQCRASLHQIQVTARSPLGAIVLNTGGVLAHDGWLRIYGGSGGPNGSVGMAEVNGFPATAQPGWLPPAGLIVAHDVLGGVFAINGADPQRYGRPGGPGGVVHFSAVTLTWQDLEMGHSEWLAWVVDGGAASLYRDLLWPTWRIDVSGLSMRQGVSVYPFPWSEEAQRDMAATAREPVPLAQLLGLHGEFCTQFGLPDPGELGSVAA